MGTSIGRCKCGAIVSARFPVHACKLDKPTKGERAMELADKLTPSHVLRSSGLWKRYKAALERLPEDVLTDIHEKMPRVDPRDELGRRRDP